MAVSSIRILPKNFTEAAEKRQEPHLEYGFTKHFDQRFPRSSSARNYDDSRALARARFREPATDAEARHRRVHSRLPVGGEQPCVFFSSAEDRGRWAVSLNYDTKATSAARRR